MKTLTVIYTGQDTDAARALAASLREGGNSTLCVDGFSDIGEIVPCDRVVVMDDVPDWRRDKIEEAYPGKVDVSEDPNKNSLCPSCRPSKSLRRCMTGRS
jgi:hypothetical protein